MKVQFSVVDKSKGDGFKVRIYTIYYFPLGIREIYVKYKQQLELAAELVFREGWGLIIL